MSGDLAEGPSCPLPAPARRVLLAHGGGGRMSQRLVERLFAPAFGPGLDARHDAALLAPPPGRLAFSTDAYVVSPLFFPGGDVGALAVNGTVNDLAMVGARPLWLSAAFVLEEGFPLLDLERVAASMRRAAEAAGVQVVTGDTKVVERGKGDGLYLVTSGVGVVEHALRLGPDAIRPGDAVLVSGDLGRHGAAVLCAREGLGLESALHSDCAPLWEPVRALLAAGLELHALRDLTRGGLASALVELSEACGLRFELDEVAIPVDEAVRGPCELLGLDPLQVANEGRFALFLPAAQAGRALELLRALPVSAGAARVGAVSQARPACVTLATPGGATRVLDMLSGEQLPRIC